MELTGRVAVVTGAASGIGYALSERFVAEGMSVVMAGRNADNLQAAADHLTEQGASVTPVVCDVADPAQVEALRDATLAAYGAAHLLCNNAGVASGTTNLKTSNEMWRWLVDVNVLGVAHGCNAFGPLFVEQGVGHIVNTSSEAGLAPSAFLGAYHATKYAVVGLSESLYLELVGTGVGVSCLCPELVDTKIFEATRNAPAELGLRAPRPVAMDQIESFMNTTAMNPIDVAGAVSYAVRADQFWILTHPISLQRVKRRNEGLEILRNPRNPA